MARETGPVAAFRLVIEYDGGRYSGWQRQGEKQSAQGVRTVAGSIERALALAGLKPLVLSGSGRTDAGVHALAQVAHLHLPKQGAPKAQELARLLGEGLPPDVALRTVEPCPAAFHARHDALSRTYLYQLALRRSAFAKPYVWWVKAPLELARLEAAWNVFQGNHDFTAFADLEPSEDPHSQVFACEVVRAGSLVLLRITARHFLRRQVRRMVGAAVDCATGRTEPSRLLRDLEKPSEAANLHWAERAAPASGLFLESVRYPGDPEPGPALPACPVR